MGENAYGNKLVYGYILFILSFFTFLLINRKQNTFWAILPLGVYIVLVFLFSITDLSSAFRGIGLLLWVFSFYFGYRVSNCSDVLARFYKDLMFLVSLLVVFYCLYYYFVKGVIDLSKAADAVFFVVVYYPFILISKRMPFFSVLAAMLIIVVSFLSLKRSIIIATGLSSVLFALSLWTKTTFRKWYFWIIVVVIMITGFFLYNSIGEIVSNRFSTVADTGGNGREDIYLNILSHYKESSISQKVVGHGYMSVKNINNDILAHNDFFQLLYDGGVFAILFYIVFWISICAPLFKSYWRRKRIGNSYYALRSTLVMYFILSMVNCFIYSYMLMSPLMASVGFMIGEINNHNRLLVK